MAHKYVKLGKKGKKIYLYKSTGTGADGVINAKSVRQVLWGDYLGLEGTETDIVKLKIDKTLFDAWELVWGDRATGESYYVRCMDTQDTRPLEVIFLDVGQGDGAVIIGPHRGDQERIILVDAGIGDNMDRFLTSRFKYKKKSFKIHASVITHPDKDHYEGFRPIFENGNLKMKYLFHNGLKEQHDTMGDRLGRKVKSTEGRASYHLELLKDDDDVRDFYGNAMDNRMDAMLYPTLLQTAINNDIVDKFQMLGKRKSALFDVDAETVIDEDEVVDPIHTWMPGLSPTDNSGFSVEVLGPLSEHIEVDDPQDIDHGKRMMGLRRISNDGKTKNGHSVLLRLEIGSFYIMLGGDLNKQSEQLLLQHYAGLSKWPKSNEERARMVASARVRLRSDIFKVCHHGAADVTDEFVQAVDPAAFIISSGDEEGHVHPRPDLLGRLGRNGRGFAPLVLSTELQRSTREKEDKKDRETIEKASATLNERRSDKASDVKARAKATEALSVSLKRLSRDNVSVYGAIHIKTDGDKLIAAFKKETDSLKSRWFYYEYQQDANGTLIPLHESEIGH